VIKPLFRVCCIALALAADVCGQERVAKPRAKALLFDEALQWSKTINPSVDPDRARKEWAALRKETKSQVEAQRQHRGKLPPLKAVEALNRCLLLDRKVSYLSNRYWRDSLFTTALLDKRGNCLSTSLLYYLMARELELPVHLAFAPEHAFVRWDDGVTVFNIETTDRGSLFSDLEGMQRFELTTKDLKNNGFLVSLTVQEQRARLFAVWSATLHSVNHRREAHSLLEEAIDIWPKNAAFRLQLAGYRLRATGRTEGAEKELKSMLEQQEVGPWTRASAALALARFFGLQGRIDDAIDCLMSSINDAPPGQRVEMATELGHMYRHRRDFDEAIRFHQLAAVLKPGEENFNELGSVLTEAHHDAEAIKAYEAALQFNSENFFTKVILSGLYERSGDKKWGRALFASIEPPRENKLTWHSALVWYYAVTKQPTQLITHMDAAFSLDASGATYGYFLREPDLDPYREMPAFAELMLRNKPRGRASGEK
jgi:tetratricopeptide (TPR) repeat protein